MRRMDGEGEREFTTKIKKKKEKNNYAAITNTYTRNHTKSLRSSLGSTFTPVI